MFALRDNVGPASAAQGEPTKTGAVEQSVLMDGVDAFLVSQACERLLAKVRKAKDRAWQSSPSRFRARWNVAMAKLMFPAKAHSHAMRHGRASRDAVTEFPRSVHGVQVCGRRHLATPMLVHPKPEL